MSAPVATWRTISKAKTRARIIEVARKLFAQRGYEGVALRDIASAANRSTGAIFMCWPGKADLFAEVVGRRAISDEEGAALAVALERIAAPMDCGCNPCRGACQSREALLCEVEELKAIASAALAILRGSK